MLTHVKMRSTGFDVVSVLFLKRIVISAYESGYIYVSKYEFMRFKILRNYELQAINIYRVIIINLYHEHEANVILILMPV